MTQGTEAENNAWESNSSHHDIIQINKTVQTTNYLHWHEDSNFLPFNCNSKSRVQSAVNSIKYSSLLSQFATFLYGFLSKTLRNIHEFYVHLSVHRESIFKNVPTGWHFFVQYFIPCKRLYMFRVKHSPIIRSSNKL
jgi:hypothetical protein